MCLTFGYVDRILLHCPGTIRALRRNLRFRTWASSTCRSSPATTCGSLARACRRAGPEREGWLGGAAAPKSCADCRVPLKGTCGGCGIATPSHVDGFLFLLLPLSPNLEGNLEDVTFLYPVLPSGSQKVTNHFPFCGHMLPESTQATNLVILKLNWAPRSQLFNSRRRFWLSLDQCTF